MVYVEYVRTYDERCLDVGFKFSYYFGATFFYIILQLLHILVSYEIKKYKYNCNLN